MRRRGEQTAMLKPKGQDSAEANPDIRLRSPEL